MSTLHAKVKKFAGLAVMATAVTAMGLGFGSGTAQAKPPHPHPHPHTTVTQNDPLHNFIQFTDTNIADPIQALFGLGEDTPFDNATDRFHGLR